MSDDKIIPFPSAEGAPSAMVQARVLQEEIRGLERRINVTLASSDRALFARNLGLLCEEYGDAHGGALKLIREIAGDFLKHRTRYIRLSDDRQNGEYARAGGDYKQIVESLAAFIGADKSLKLRLLRRLVTETSLAAPELPMPSSLDDRKQALRDLAQIASRIAEQAQLGAFFSRVRNLPIKWDVGLLANGAPPIELAFEGGDEWSEEVRAERIAQACARINGAQWLAAYFENSAERLLPIAFRGPRPDFETAGNFDVEAALLPAVAIGTVHVPVAVLSVDLHLDPTDIKALNDVDDDADKCALRVRELVARRFGRAPSDESDDDDTGGRPAPGDPWSVREWSSGHVDGEWCEHAAFVGDSTEFWGSPHVEDWDGRSAADVGRAWRRLYLAHTLDLTLQPCGDRIVFGLRLRRKESADGSPLVTRMRLADVPRGSVMRCFIRDGRLFLWRCAGGDFVLEAADERLTRSASTAINSGDAQCLLFSAPGDLSDDGQAGAWDKIRTGRRAFELDLPECGEARFSPVAPDTLAGRLLSCFLAGGSEDGLAQHLLETARCLVAKFEARLDQAAAAYDAALDEHWRKA